MKTIALALIVMFTFQSFAQQLSFDFGIPDEILAEMDVYPGDKNLKFVEFKDLPKKIQNTLSDIDLAFILGDGYYDYLSGATYEVYSDEGKLVGYYTVDLLSYTQDPEYYLAAAKITLDGKSKASYESMDNGLEYDDIVINIFDSIEQANESLPKELHVNKDDLY
jgi:hypothetical protein